MTKEATRQEIAAALTVLLMLVGLPALLWYWRAGVIPARYPPGTKIIHLTAISNGAVWTEDHIAGYQYWWKKPARVPLTPLTPGDHVVLLLHSSDVEHSFTIPSLHIGPVAIPAGHTVEVEFDVPRAGELKFFCTQVCGREHRHLEGRFLIAARGELSEPADPRAASRPPC